TLVLRALKALAPSIELVPDGGHLTAEGMATVLGIVVNSVLSRSARQFLRWKLKRIQRIQELDELRMMTRPWWSTSSAIGQWTAASWFPALLVALYVVPAIPEFDRLVWHVAGY